MTARGSTFLKHKGIYGFTLESLRRYCGFPQENLKRESLEQLRALEYGMKIRCLVCNFESIGSILPKICSGFVYK